VRLAADLARSRGTGEDLAAAALTRAVAAHASWTRKIITARALQAVTVLDIQCYRDLVWEAGGYGEG
jgi:hypothetical protein